MIVGAWFYCSEFSDFLKCIREAAYSKSSFSSLRCASDFFPLLRARPNPEMDFRLSRKSASDDDDDDDNKRTITVVVQAQCCPHLELNVNHHQTVFTTV